MLLYHPARHYIYYLFSKRGMNTEDLIIHLDDLRLPLPQIERELTKFTSRLLRARSAMYFPPHFDPMAPVMNQETAAFLSRWGIADMWRGDPFVGRAVDLLDEPIVRRMLEALLLGPISPMSIAARIRERFGFSEEAMNVRVVRAFSHYFWDPSSMNAVQWRTLIHRWLPDKDNYDYLGALNSPRSPAGAALTLALVDRSAESLNPVVQYGAFRDHGFSMFMEHALLQNQPSLSRTQSAFLAFQMVKLADEELTKHRGGSADLLEEFRKIETVYDRKPMTSVKDLPALSAPRVIDVQPVEEEIEAPAHTEDKEIA